MAKTPGGSRAGPTSAWAAYRYKAKKKGVPWNLTRSQFLSLVSKPCYYCFEPPSNGTEKHGYYSGLDRVNNRLGYTLDNVVPCCKDCNQIKSDVLEADEMRAAAQAIQWVRRKRGLRGGP